MVSHTHATHTRAHTHTHAHTNTHTHTYKTHKCKHTTHTLTHTHTTHTHTTHTQHAHTTHTHNLWYVHLHQTSINSYVTEVNFSAQGKSIRIQAHVQLMLQWSVLTHFACTMMFHSLYISCYYCTVGSKFSVWRHLTATGRTATAVTNQEKETRLVETRLVCKLYNKCISIFSQVVTPYKATA